MSSGQGFGRGGRGEALRKVAAPVEVYMVYFYLFLWPFVLLGARATYTDARRAPATNDACHYCKRTKTIVPEVSTHL